MKNPYYKKIHVLLLLNIHLYICSIKFIKFKSLERLNLL